MTPEQISLARHALGLNGCQRKSYRNHFATGPNDGIDHAQWEAMVAAGYAVKQRHRLATGMDLFSLTTQGACAVLRPGEKLDPEDFPDAPTNAPAPRL